MVARALPLDVGVDGLGERAFLPLMVVVVVAMVLLLLRHGLKAKTRNGVQTNVLVPGREHGEKEESIRQREANIGSAVHRAGLDPLTGTSDFIRRTHRPDPKGQLLTLVSVPAHGVPAVRSAFGSLPAVTLRPLAAVALPADPLAPPPDLAYALALAAADGDPDALPPVVTRHAKITNAARKITDAARKIIQPPPAVTDGEPVVTEDEDDDDQADPLGADADEPDAPAGAPADDSTARKDKRKGPRFYTARQELTINGPFIGMLTSENTLTPNLLGAVAEVYRGLHMSRGEDAAVVVDQMPVGAWGRARYLRRLSKELDTAAKQTDRLTSIASQIRAGLDPKGQYLGPVTTTKKETPTPSSADVFTRERHELRKRTAGTQPLAALRITLVVRCTTRKRARGTVKALQTALTPMNGTAWLRPTGASIGIGPWRTFLTVPGRSLLIDRNLRRWHMPRGARIATALEVMPLVGPCTKEAASENVRRTAPLPPMPQLPVYDRDDPSLLPLGKTHTAIGKPYIAALPARDYLMGLRLAGTQQGKTTTEITTTIHVARSTPGGVTWLDPEGKVFDTIAPYLTDIGRPVNVIDLRRDKQPAWNLLDMSNKPREEADDIVSAVVGAIKNALRWDDRSNRALTILTMSLRSLLRVNTLLCERNMAHLQATIFTVPFLLNNEAFHNLIQPLLPPDHQRYWKEDYANLDKSATPVVTNLMNRLRGDYSPLGAFLGRPVSTYNMRRALENGELTFICPTADSDKDRLVANLFLFDFIRESKRREDATGLLPHYLWLDELPVYDSNDGLVASIYEMLRKRGVKATGLGQTAHRLSGATRDGLFPNLSNLTAGPADDKDAKLHAVYTHAPVEVFGDLEHHHWISRFRMDGVKVGPVPLLGLRPEDVWSDHYHPEKVPALVERIDRHFDRKTRVEVAPDLDAADANLAEYLSTLDLVAPGPRRPHRFSED